MQLIEVLAKVPLIERAGKWKWKCRKWLHELKVHSSVAKMEVLAGVANDLGACNSYIIGNSGNICNKLKFRQELDEILRLVIKWKCGQQLNEI